MTRQSIEHRTKKIARQICLTRNEDENLWQLHLSTAYAIIISSEFTEIYFERQYDQRKKTNI